MIGRRSFLLLVSNLISAVLGFVGLFAMTRYLGAEVYGVVSFTLALVTTLNSFSDLGFGSAHIKRVSEGLDIGDCVSTYVSVKVVLAGLTVAIVVVGLLFWNCLTGGSLDPISVRLALLFLLYYVFYNLGSIMITTYTATMEMAKAQVISLINPMIRVPLVVIVLAGGMGAVEVAYAYVLAGLCILLAGGAFFLRDGIRWRKPTLTKSYRRFATPLALISVIGVVVGSLDKLMIGFFADSRAVAYYSSSQFLLSMIAMVGVAVSTMTFPSFSKLHKEGRIDEIKTLTLSAERYISMIGMPVTVLVFIYPSEIAMLLFGSDFRSAGEPMRYISLAMLLSMLNEVHLSQILALNRPEVTAKLTMAYFILLSALLVVLVPDDLFGAPMAGLSYTGAAIAYLLATGMVFVLRRVVVWRLTGTGSSPRMLLHVVSALLVGISLVLLPALLSLGNWIQLILYGLFAYAMFASLLVMFGELKRGDLRYFLAVVNPPKLGMYIWSELRGVKPEEVRSRYPKLRKRR